MHLSVGGTGPTAWRNRQNRPSRNRQTIKTEDNRPRPARTPRTPPTPPHLNCTFEDGGGCAAIADRITFRCTLIQTGTDSYRYQATHDERQAKKR